MKIEIEDIDSCNKKIKFDIPHQDYQAKIRDYYKSLGREVKIPGFRKGKAPIQILEKQFGPRVKQEALTELISERVMAAIQEKGIRAVSQPNLLEVHAEEGTDINVSASVEVLPEVELKDYSDIEIHLKIPKVTDEEVDQMIEGFRKNKAKTVPVTGRSSQKDDLIKIDFDGTLDGKPFEGGQAKDYVIQLGANQLIEDLEKNLYGMEIGEVKQVKVKIPDDYFNKTIAGREVEFTITLKGIQVKELPELNDEFARSLESGKYESVEDMRAKIRQEMESYERSQARRKAFEELEDKLVEQHPVNVPEGLIQEQIRFMVRKAREKEQRETGGEAEASGEISPADQEKYREPAIKILQKEILIDKLATDLNIDVSEKDLDEEVKTLARMMGGGDLDRMKQEWKKSGVIAKLHSRMRRERTLEAVLDKVKVKEEMVDRADLIADN